MPKWAIWFIHVFLGVQVILAFRYYLAAPDPRDERWAWRMFSPIRMEHCDTDITVGDSPRPAQLGRRFHEAWLTIASRGRTGVILDMAEELCEEHPGLGVRVRIACAGVHERVARGLCRGQTTLARKEPTSSERGRLSTLCRQVGRGDYDRDVAEEILEAFGVDLRKDELENIVSEGVFDVCKTGRL